MTTIMAISLLVSFLYASSDVQIPPLNCQIPPDPRCKAPLLDSRLAAGSAELPWWLSVLTIQKHCLVARG